MKPKILIATYYWPPAGGIAVQRWLQFANHLVALGYEVFVYTAENASYPLVDEELIHQVSPEITVIQQKIWEPYGIAEKLNPKNKEFKEGKFDTENSSWVTQFSVFVRGNFFIPDARKFWVKPSIRFLQKYLKENEIFNLITTGPPHSVHLIGLGLKKQIESLNWIADFRDPWTEISYHKELKLTPWAEKKHLKLEKEVMQTADHVVAASFTDAENYTQLGANVTSITNGFDTLLETTHTQNPQFTISYIGKLELQRNASSFWECIEEIAQENKEFEKQLIINMVGSIDPRVQSNLEKSAIAHHIRWIGFVSFEKAKEYMQKSDVLLIFNFVEDAHKGIIPGKLFEYLSTQNPILSVGPKEADVAQILEETESGKHFIQGEKRAMKSYILGCYENWKNAKKNVYSPKVNQYSRRNLTQKFIPLFSNEKI